MSLTAIKIEYISGIEKPWIVTFIDKSRTDRHYPFWFSSTHVFKWLNDNSITEYGNNNSMMYFKHEADAMLCYLRFFNSA